MAWHPTLYSLLGFGAAGTSAAVAILAWRHRDEPGARPLLWLMIALGGWSMFYGVQLGFTTWFEQDLFQRICLAIGGTVPTLWLVFALEYAGYDGWKTRGRQVLLAIDPVVFAILTLTNPIHGLVWDDSTLTSMAAGPVLDLSIGIGYYIHIAYGYLVVVTGLGLLVLLMERASPIYRRQTGVLILGVVPPFGANIAFTLQLWGGIPAIDFTPFALVFTGLMWGLALFRFDLLRRTPIARRRFHEEMGDGLMVLDTDGCVLNANTVARDALDPAPTVGDSIVESCPDDVETVNAARESMDGRTLSATVDSRSVVYDVKWSPLTGRRGKTVGHAVAFRDVTDRKEYEQRLEVSQRVLRHNLRNDMTTIRGWAEELPEGPTDGQPTAAQRIVETADDLIELSEKTRTMIDMHESAAAERRPLDVGTHLGTLIEEFRERHADVTIECSIPDSVTVWLPHEDFLHVPVRNLIENAIEHNDADEPLIRVDVESTDEQVRISVEDNGPPIPDIEHEVLEDGTENPLKHGSGMGLWLTYWSARALGGKLRFEPSNPRGNSVTIELPSLE